MLNRAAQFSPFAALTGYDATVKETARLTDEKIALDEYAKSMLSDKLQMIAEHIDDLPEGYIHILCPGQKEIRRRVCKRHRGSERDRRIRADRGSG